MIIEKYFPQYSDEWWLARRGRFGASEATPIRVAGAGLKNLAHRKAFELSIASDELYLQWLQRDRQYKSEQMDMGSANQLFAKENAEIILGKKIREIGICLYGDWACFSPDGRIDEWNCGAEIKNIDSPTGQEKYLLASQGAFDKLDDYDQIQYSLALSGWDFWLYILYSEVLFGETPQIFKIERDNRLIMPFLRGLVTGKNILVKRLTEYATAREKGVNYEQ